MDSELYCKLFVYIHIDIITCWEKNIIIVIITTFQTSDLLIDQIKNVILANERKEISLTESLKENYIAKAKAVAYIIDNIPAYEGVNILVFMERGIYEDCTRMYAPYY